MPNKGKYRWQCLMSCGDALAISEARMVSGRHLRIKAESLLQSSPAMCRLGSQDSYH